MANIETLEQRLARAKAALREAKRREQIAQEKRIFDVVKRAGLSLADVENLLAASGKNGGESAQENEQ
ncbi:MAG: hypothetical protein J0I76_12260 [Thiobacillus sp.]|nr:hypothetical protein [Thiobacillus sp.]